jgi:hypothetical protein
MSCFDTTRRGFVAAVGGLGAAADTAFRSARQSGEPDMAQAFTWWGDLPNKWTPIGWKNHLFRFNVLFNGTVVAQPDLNRRSARWKGEGVQLSLMPAPSARWYASRFPANDNGSVVQHWREHAAPVLHSRWAMDGLLFGQEIFAHVRGAGDVATGIEPLFAWMRLSVEGVVEGLPLEENCGFLIRISAPHIARTMAMRNNLIYRPELAAYPRELTPDPGQYSAGRGYCLVEPDGRVRLAAPRGSQCEMMFQRDREPLLYVRMKARAGARVDLLVPMLPASREVVEEELSLGYEGALAEANRYWAVKPATAAVVDVPEPFVNAAVQHSLKLAEVIAERDPATGDYTVLTGSWTYADVWATPNAMTLVQLLDNFGYHASVTRYLAVFKRHQGAVTPPGRAFTAHSGYLATPKSLTAINWLTDHGAILWAMAQHALVCGDDGFLTAIVRACEFIRDARRIKGHAGVPGLMPPAVASDRKTEIQAVWSDGWMYKGLTTAVRLLRRMGDARAAEFATEAADYQRSFLAAFREKAARMPSWTGRDGTRHRLAPISLSGDSSAELRHAFYLDAGPLFLVFAGLLPAEDPLARSTLLWFREGPPAKGYAYDSECWQVPSLHHEISSCEPCYSWNIFHSHCAGDRVRFLEGMYSLLAGGLSRQTFTTCETRGGITGLTPCLPAFYMLRLSVIDDQVAPGELHLLRLMPLAWLSRNREARFENVPTEFGPVTLGVKLGANGTELAVRYSARWRQAPGKVWLHVPPNGIGRVTVNGKRTPFDERAKRVQIV